MTKAPTVHELAYAYEPVFFEEEENDYELVDKDIITKWRWGTVERAIFQHKPTGKYWAVQYRVSGEPSESHGLMDETVDPKEIYEVYKGSRVVIEWRRVDRNLDE